MEPGTNQKDVATVNGELQELADWLGLDRVAVGNVIREPR
jgi:uncharacterized protein YcaQ